MDRRDSGCKHVVNKRMPLPGCRKNPPLRPIPARLLQCSAPVACRRDWTDVARSLHGPHPFLIDKAHPSNQQPCNQSLPCLPCQPNSSLDHPQESDFTLPVSISPPSTLLPSLTILCQTTANLCAGSPLTSLASLPILLLPSSLSTDPFLPTFCLVAP